MLAINSPNLRHWTRRIFSANMWNGYVGLLMLIFSAAV